jgi:hypothetical protein
MTDKRSIVQTFRLSQQESAALDKAVSRSGLTKAEYLRQRAKGLQPTDNPPLEYWRLNDELGTLNDNLKSLATYDREAVEPLLAQTRRTLVDVSREVLEPKRAG